MSGKERLKEILAPIEPHLAEVERLVMQNLETDIPLLTQVGQHILLAGGKRIRPAMLLFAAGAVGKITPEAYLAANLVEYIHTATLLHDDVVDHADLRRSKKSARSIWGNEASVLVGDYLFTVSFQHLANLGRMDLVEALARCTTLMARGEILQLVRSNETATEAEYLEIVFHKTASLMGVAMQMGALIAGAEAELAQRFYACGKAIGMAFQLVDDALDYQVDSQATGKEQGTDLKERKVTLPLSHLLEQAGAEVRKEVVAILEAPEITPGHMARVVELMRQYGSVEYTRQRAEGFIEQALALLSPLAQNPCTRSMADLARFVVARDR